MSEKIKKWCMKVKKFILYFVGVISFLAAILTIYPYCKNITQPPSLIDQNNVLSDINFRNLPTLSIEDLDLEHEGSNVYIQAFIKNRNNKNFGSTALQCLNDVIQIEEKPITKSYLYLLHGIELLKKKDYEEAKNTFQKANSIKSTIFTKRFLLETYQKILNNIINNASPNQDLPNKDLKYLKKLNTEIKSLKSSLDNNISFFDINLDYLFFPANINVTKSALTNIYYNKLIDIYDDSFLFLNRPSFTKNIEKSNRIEISCDGKNFYSLSDIYNRTTIPNPTSIVYFENDSNNDQNNKILSNIINKKCSYSTDDYDIKIKLSTLYPSHVSRDVATIQNNSINILAYKKHSINKQYSEIPFNIINKNYFYSTDDYDIKINKICDNCYLEIKKYNKLSFCIEKSTNDIVSPPKVIKILDKCAYNSIKRFPTLSPTLVSWYSLYTTIKNNSSNILAYRKQYCRIPFNIKYKNCIYSNDDYDIKINNICQYKRLFLKDTINYSYYTDNHCLKIKKYKFYVSKDKTKDKCLSIKRFPKLCSSLVSRHRLITTSIKNNKRINKKNILNNQIPYSIKKRSLDKLPTLISRNRFYCPNTNNIVKNIKRVKQPDKFASISIKKYSENKPTFLNKYKFYSRNNLKNNYLIKKPDRNKTLIERDKFHFINSFRFSNKPFIKYFQNSSRVDTRLLSIGINKYFGKFKPLKYAKSDATNISKSLKKYGYESIVLQDEKATKSNILKFLYHEVLNSKPDDSFVLYIAGHGFSDINDNLFIVPYNYKKNYSVISLYEIGSLLSYHKGKTYILLDTCFDRKKINLSNYIRSIPIKDNNKSLLLLASNFNKSIESKKLSSGLMTYFVLKYLNEDAFFPYSNDILHATDKKIDFLKMFSYIIKNTKDFSISMFHYEQTPLLSVLK